MTYTAIIEIPKNSDRRIHKSIETGEFVDFGPTKEIIPVNEGKMPVAYGFIENTLNKGEGDEVDVLVFSNKEYITEEKVEVEIIGMIVREDGDHKIITKDVEYQFSEISDLPKEEWQLTLDFFGHKHRITSILDKENTLKYLEESTI